MQDKPEDGSMFVGNRDDFGIELDLVQHVGGWALGRFVFYLAGHVAGDPDDESVHLKGCVGWMRDFVEHPQNRFEPGLYAMPKEEVFWLLSTELEIPGRPEPAPSPVKDALSRFHISHLGMSSFDRVTILLVEDAEGRQRCIWQQNDDGIREAFLSPGRMQQVCITRAAALGLAEDV